MKKIVSSIVVAGLLATSLCGADAKTENVKHNAVVNMENKAQSTHLIKEAVLALQYTNDAYIYLKSKNKDKALISLKKAIGELSVVLNNPKAPYLLPVNVDVEAVEYIGDIKNISNQVRMAKVELAKGHLLATRTILNSLRSEIDVKAVNIPLATYPDVISLAIKYLNENKVKEATDVIAMALNTLVTTNTIIPIPILKANELVMEASKIAKNDKKQALKYLEESKKQLKMAELLGYSSISNTTYKSLKDKINNIESKINNNKNTESFFNELKAKLEEFKNKAVSVISK